MANDMKLVLHRLDEIKDELASLAKRTRNVDVVVTEDDLDALRDAERDYAEGKTTRI